jgi:NodT family efflux transporter outer membrane factor (OMF) lipoprotein
MKFIESICLSAAAVLAGCTVGPDYHKPRMNVPARFNGATTQPSSMAARLTTMESDAVAPPFRAVDVARWWESLNDPELNALVDRAITANPDLHIALNRLQQSREVVVVVTGQEVPMAEFAAGAGRGSGTNSTKGRISQPLNAGTNTGGYREITQVGGFDAIWEMDLFGQLRREGQAAVATAMAARDARDQVLVTLIGDVVRAYSDVRSLQQRVAVNKQAIAVNRQSADYAEGRYRQGLANELDARLAERELHVAESTLKPLEAQLAASQRGLAVLLGEFPEDLGNELAATAPLPNPPAALAAGVPAEVLRRRPDVNVAENQLIAANARIGVATANLYPQIFLTGGVGVQGQGLGVAPVQWKDIWSIGPSVRWALFDFGTLDAAINIEDYRTREMMWNYRKTVINAVREVDDALWNYQAQRDREAQLLAAQIAAQRALEVANGRYQQGIIDFLNVMDAQRQLYAIEDQYAQAREATIVQFAAVYKSLGGGWESFTKVPDIKKPKPAILAAIEKRS